MSAARGTTRTPKTRARANRSRDWTGDFLAALEHCGTVVEACRRAQVARTTVYRHRDEDAKFAEAWREVDDILVERMEREAYRRAVEGVHRDIFHQGTVVGDERVYSDTLLIFLLKAKRPATYRDNVKVEHTGEGGGPVQLDVLGGRQPAELSPKQRREIAKILAG